MMSVFPCRAHTRALHFMYSCGCAHGASSVGRGTSNLRVTACAPDRAGGLARLISRRQRLSGFPSGVPRGRSPSRCSRSTLEVVFVAQPGLCRLRNSALGSLRRRDGFHSWCAPPAVRLHAHLRTWLVGELSAARLSPRKKTAKSACCAAAHNLVDDESLEARGNSEGAFLFPGFQSPTLAVHTVHSWLQRRCGVSPSRCGSFILSAAMRSAMSGHALPSTAAIACLPHTVAQ